MFKRITIDNGIKHNGVTFDFNTGITAITGPNGCGKSLLAEYMGFALFGVKALRLPAEKYKGLSVKAEVTIKDKNYTISRKVTNCEIKRDDTVICTGTKPCNLKIIELLGYNYSVYKMGNYAAQFQITEFGELPPSERKKAVDQVLGLSIIDTLIKYSNDEGNRYLAEVTGMMNVLQKPEGPTKPEFFDDADIIANQLNAIKVIIDRKRLLKQLYSSLGNMPAPVKPIRPEGVAENLTAGHIKDILSRKKLLEYQADEFLRQIRPQYSLEQLEEMEAKWPAYEAYVSYLDKLEMIPKVKPEISLSEALSGRAMWNTYSTWKKAQEELISCPKCGTKFTKAGSSVNEEDIPQCPKKTEKYYIDQVDLNHIWENTTIPTPVEPAERPELFMYEIQNQKSLIFKWGERENKLPVIQKELEEYKDITDLMFAQVQAYELAVVDYENKKKAWKDYLDKAHKYKTELDQLEGLGDVEKVYEELDKKAEAIKLFNIQMKEYSSQLETYLTLKNQIEEIKAKGDNYKLASTKLKEVKTEIKQVILPSLAKLASKLLSEMSEGLYNSVEIDEDFNITINGLEIAGYSGSEKSMANLAIRIALGQVLTHKSFNVFIGDEIDDSMRSERAQATADCLKKLSKHINQIILISHRDIEADNYINL